MPTATKIDADDQVRDPDPVARGCRRSGRRIEGDRQQGHGDDGRREHDDAEDDGPGGEGERADRLVLDEVDDGVDGVRTFGGQVVQGGTVPGRRTASGGSGFGSMRPRIPRRRWPPPEPRPGATGRTSVDGDHADADGPRSGVGADDRAELADDQRVLGLHVGEQGQEVVDVGGGAVGDGDPAQRRATAAPCRPGTERPRPRVRCLDSSATSPSTRVTTGLIESNEPSRARAPPMRPPFSRCSRVSTRPNTDVRGDQLGHPRLEGVEVGAGGGQVGDVEDHQTEAHGHRARVERPAPRWCRRPPWPPPPRPGTWRTPRRTGSRLSTPS